MDQLYSLALGAAPLLERRCREWAARSGGRLDDAEVEPADRGPEVPPHGLDGAGSSAIDRLVRRRLVKGPARAIEKALARRGGDAARLLDVCRARILFERVADVCACLEAVRAQRREVRVLRVANGMAPDRDAAPSGGFRVRRLRHWTSV